MGPLCNLPVSGKEQTRLEFFCRASDRQSDRQFRSLSQGLRHVVE